MIFPCSRSFWIRFLTPLEAFSNINATNYWVQYQATIPSGNYSIIFEMSASIYINYKILKLDDIAVQPGECSEGNVICRTHYPDSETTSFYSFSLLLRAQNWYVLLHLRNLKKILLIKSIRNLHNKMETHLKFMNFALWNHKHEMSFQHLRLLEWWILKGL
jgi:hypothetical protein